MRIERWRPFGSVERWDPFRGGLNDIQSEVNRLFDSVLGRPSAVEAMSGTRVWIPLVDMYETKDDVILSFVALDHG